MCELLNMMEDTFGTRKLSDVLPTKTATNRDEVVQYVKYMASLLQRLEEEYNSIELKHAMGVPTDIKFTVDSIRVPQRLLDVVDVMDKHSAFYAAFEGIYSKKIGERGSARNNLTSFIGLSDMNVSQDKRMTDCVLRAVEHTNYASAVHWFREVHYSLNMVVSKMSKTKQVKVSKGAYYVPTIDNSGLNAAELFAKTPCDLTFSAEYLHVAAADLTETEINTLLKYITFTKNGLRWRGFMIQILKGATSAMYSMLGKPANILVDKPVDAWATITKTLLSTHMTTDQMSEEQLESTYITLVEAMLHHMRTESTVGWIPRSTSDVEHVKIEETPVVKLVETVELFGKDLNIYWDTMYRQPLYPDQQSGRYTLNVDYDVHKYLAAAHLMCDINLPTTSDKVKVGNILRGAYTDGGVLKLIRHTESRVTLLSGDVTALRMIRNIIDKTDDVEVIVDHNITRTVSAKDVPIPGTTPVLDKMVQNLLKSKWTVELYECGSLSEMYNWLNLEKQSYEASSLQDLTTIEVLNRMLKVDMDTCRKQMNFEPDARKLWEIYAVTGERHCIVDSAVTDKYKNCKNPPVLVANKCAEALWIINNFKTTMWVGTNELFFTSQPRAEVLMSLGVDTSYKLYQHVTYKAAKNNAMQKYVSNESSALWVDMLYRTICVEGADVTDLSSLLCVDGILYSRAVRLQQQFYKASHSSVEVNDATMHALIKKGK